MAVIIDNMRQVLIHGEWPQWSSITAVAFTRRSVSPGVVATGADAMQPTHRSHRVVFLVLVDEGEDVTLRCEVNAMAFFKRSCSICRR